MKKSIIINTAPIQQNLIGEIRYLMEELHLCTSTDKSEEMFKTTLGDLLIKHDAYDKKLIPKLLSWLNSNKDQQYAQVNRDFTIRVLIEKQEEYQFNSNPNILFIQSSSNYEVELSHKLNRRFGLNNILDNYLSKLSIQLYCRSIRRRAVAIIEHSRYRRMLISKLDKWVNKGPGYRRFIKISLQLAYRILLKAWPVLTILNLKNDEEGIFTDSQFLESDRMQLNI